MGNVSHFQSGWSISRLAEELRLDRRTVAKRLRDAGIPPAGKRNGSDVYQLADVALALLAPELAGGAGGGVVDPRDLPPKDRKDFYQSENERLKFETSTGALVPAVEVEAEMAELVKTMVQFIETLPDVLERKLSLSSEQVIAVQDRCDHIRQQLYEKITQEVVDGDVRDSA